MQLAPNKSRLKGRIRKIIPAADGWGADVEFEVDSCVPADGQPDFVRAEPGAVITLFAAEPELLEPGKDFTVTASALGGPDGERVVIGDAQAIGKR